MSIFSLCGFMILAAILCAVLKGANSSASNAVAWVCLTGSALYALSAIKPVTELITELGDITGMKTVMKALGISFFCSLSCDLCRQSGENSLAKSVEISGKAVICAMCVPMVTRLIEIIGEMTN